MVEVSAPLTLMRLSTLSDMNKDWEIVRDNQDQQSPYLNIKYHLQTHDRAIIYLSTIGTKPERKDILGGLTTGDHKPTSYELCLQVTVKTEYPAYSWLNQAVIVGCSVKTEDMLIYDAYQLG